MKFIKILSVGKIKNPHWQQAAIHYLKRISHSAKVEHITVKDARPKLPKDVGMQEEGAALLKLVKPSDILICMDETGENPSSEKMATMLQKLYDMGKTPCFCIGGAYGHSPAVKKRANYLISLSSMTFPHEMALVILLEQIYRSETIIMGTGYHH